MIVACDNCGKKNRVPAAAAGTPQCANCHKPLAWIADVQDSDFGEVADQSRMPVLVDLWAPWCGPCRMVSPALERLAHEFAGRVKLVKVNVDEAPELSRRFEAQSIPTLLLLDHGRTVARQIGAVPESALRTWLEQGLAQTGQTAG
ncbi:MAG TPA: thioredoxin [Acidimicrobiales bacterium]|nr:thioredoxin [Acidimicrobiales bacterium]